MVLITIVPIPKVPAVLKYEANTPRLLQVKSIKRFKEGQNIALPSKLCSLITPLPGPLQNDDSIFGLNVMNGERQFRNRLNDSRVAFGSGVVKGIIQINPMFEKSTNAFSIWLMKQVIPFSIVTKIKIELSCLRIGTIDSRLHAQILLFTGLHHLFNTSREGISFCQPYAFQPLSCHA